MSSIIPSHSQSYYSNQVRQLLHTESPRSEKPGDLMNQEEEETVRNCLDPDYVKLNTGNYCKARRKKRKETVV